MPPPLRDRDVSRASVAVPRPFDAASILGFLRARQAPAIETIGDGAVTRSVRVDGAAAQLHLTFGEARITIQCSAEVEPPRLRAMARRMFDLDADVDAFRAHVARDRLLGPLVLSRPGLRVPQFLDPFECVVRAVLGQQVSVRAATTLVNRLAVMFGGFPTADAVAAAGPERLQTIGLTRTRSLTLHGVGVAIASGRVDLEALRAAPAAEAQAALDALPGIGPWTASYVRMRGLGDRDAFPAADLGVLHALRATPAEAERRSTRWSPWRAYAVMHLWTAGAGGSRAATEA
jgi:AraC family transcriptional regulator, regulatory protein of adaptative response / DNA-3-methyladenine glycosylase II